MRGACSRYISSVDFEKDKKRGSQIRVYQSAAFYPVHFSSILSFFVGEDSTMSSIPKLLLTTGAAYSNQFRSVRPRPPVCLPAFVFTRSLASVTRQHAVHVFNKLSKYYPIWEGSAMEYVMSKTCPHFHRQLVVSQQFITSQPHYQEYKTYDQRKELADIYTAADAVRQEGVEVRGRARINKET